MAFYRDRILPPLIHLSMRSRQFTPCRERVLASASGRMLEVGFGAGANLPFYGATTDARVRKWQHRLNPLWKHLAGGCHLDRAMDILIQDAGFQITHLETGYMRGGTPMSFTYEGIALQC